MPRRATLSSYAGPMPRPVVPIALPPAAFSRAWSRAMWYGMISGVAGLIFSRERTSTPLDSSSSISLRSAAGLSTTPLPIRHSASGRRMPEGIRCSTVLWPPITRVWPALWPPWKRATAPTSSVSRSTILPLPSSPHWAPNTTTDCPISARLLQERLPPRPRDCPRRRPPVVPPAPATPRPGVPAWKKPGDRLAWIGPLRLLCIIRVAPPRGQCRRSAAHEVQRHQAQGQHHRADAADLGVGQRQHLLGGAFPAAGGDEQHQAFKDGDEAEGGPEVFHGSGGPGWRMWGTGAGACARARRTPPRAGRGRR